MCDMEIRSRDERGNAMSAFIAMLVLAFIIIGGLATDGARHSAATRQCEAAAMRAALAGADAASDGVIAGEKSTVDAVRAARASLATDGYSGTVSIVSGEVVVHTSTVVKCHFLSLIGINTLLAQGDSSARLTGR